MLNFNKKEKPQPNWIDTKADEYRDALWDIKNSMNNNIQKILIIQQFINCLPDGPDKELEEKRLENHKNSLLCNIGAYDGVLADWRIMLKKASEEDKANMLHHNNVPVTSSHDYAKILIKQFYGFDY